MLRIFSVAGGCKKDVPAFGMTVLLFSLLERTVYRDNCEGLSLCSKKVDMEHQPPELLTRRRCFEPSRMIGGPPRIERVRGGVMFDLANAGSQVGKRVRCAPQCHRGIFDKDFRNLPEIRYSSFRYLWQQ